MFRQSTNNPILLGIHDQDENKEVLIGNNPSSQEQGEAKDKFLQQILSATKGMQMVVMSMASNDTKRSPDFFSIS